MANNNMKPERKKSNLLHLDHSARSEECCDEYLIAMKRVHQQSNRNVTSIEMMTPRERHRNRESINQAIMKSATGNWMTIQQATRVSTIVSMVPDEIIYKHSDYTVRSYDTALMFIDISGFTDLCENYTKPGRGGPSRLTQVLNSYIGAMVQEILMHNGDVLKFSGDAFLSMWKKTPRLSMQDVVHTAIDCALIIQKNYGTYMTDVGVVLKVKVAISAGRSHFSIIGGGNDSSHYVIVGQPVWDVKMAEYMSTAGDVLTSASAWIYVNEAEYCTQPCGDGKHTKVLGVGVNWKRVEKFHGSLASQRGLVVKKTLAKAFFIVNKKSFLKKQTARSHNQLDYYGLDTPESPIYANLPSFGNKGFTEINYREYSLRPAVLSAMDSSWWPSLRPFMVTPVLRAVDNDEPMDFLTEVRRVVVVFLNIVTKTVTEDVLISIVDTAYKCVCSVTSESGGLVNKVSMFDKDMMFLVVFGLRGLKHEDEAQNALLFAHQLREKLDDPNIINISIGVTSGTTYCGVVGHVLRREYTVIGAAVNKAVRLMMAYPMRTTCDKETFLRSKLAQEYFRLVEQKYLKGIPKPGPIYEFNKFGWPERLNGWRLLGRNEELRKYKMTIQNAVNQQNQKFTRYRDHKYAVAFIGPSMVGKTRLLEECLHITPHYVHNEKIVLTEENKAPYAIFRKIMSKGFPNWNLRSDRENFENMIRYSMDTASLKPVQIHAINVIFDCRFPLPEQFSYDGDFLKNYSVRQLLIDFFKYVKF